ncbi:MAG: hypothetical protein ABW007_18715 [Chitinophagaceae bacterium]
MILTAEINAFKKGLTFSFIIALFLGFSLFSEYYNEALHREQVWRHMELAEEQMAQIKKASDTTRIRLPCDCLSEEEIKKFSPSRGLSIGRFKINDSIAKRIDTAALLADGQPFTTAEVVRLCFQYINKNVEDSIDRKWYREAGIFRAPDITLPLLDVSVPKQLLILSLEALLTFIFAQLLLSVRSIVGTLEYATPQEKAALTNIYKRRHFLRLKNLFTWGIPLSLFCNLMLLSPSIFYLWGFDVNAVHVSMLANLIYLALLMEIGLFIILIVFGVLIVLQIKRSGILSLI